MSCEIYNLVKEGNISNTLESGLTLLGDDAIRALYDGDYASSVVTVSGSPDGIGLMVEFGESFDVCYVDYHTDETDLNNVQVRFGGDTTVSGFAALSTTASGVRAAINHHVTHIEIAHTVSGTEANVKQLEVIGTRNETLGFGESKAEEIDKLYMPHATVGTLSASPTVVPLYNDNGFDGVAKIAVAPTNTEADDYIFIATTPTGTYYGINDYGFRQPGANHNELHDDDFVSATIDPQWELRTAGHQHSVTPTAEGLYFDIPLKLYEDHPRSFVGLIGRDSFTAHSFTAEVDIKFLSVYTPNYQWGRDIFMVLTNNFPIPDVGVRSDYLLDQHRGWSVGGLALRPEGINISADTETLTFQCRWVDGTPDDNLEGTRTADRWSGGAGTGMTEEEGYSMDQFEDILFEGGDFGDLGEESEWHRWKLVYDHKKQELSGYVNNIHIGSYIYRRDPFKEGCKLAIGSGDDIGFRWVLRNFRIYHNKVYRQKNVALAVNGGVASATVSGTADNLAALIDGDDTTAYVGPDPTTSLTHVRVDFDQEYDVAYYRLRQRPYTRHADAFGKEYYPDVARTSIVDFGGKKSYVHHYPNLHHSRNDAWPRSPTYSGTAVVASGISYVNLQFTTYARTAHDNGALIIEELGAYAEEVIDRDPPEAENVREVPWVEGRWTNLKQIGPGPALTLKDYSVHGTEAAWWPIPEYFQAFVDYGFSSAQAGRQFTNTAIEYHHGEALFTSPGSTHAGDYSQWHSEDQGGSTIYLWRYFTEMRRVKSIYWDSSTLRPSNIANKFKFQYLKEEGDPKSSDDWVDIPPIAVSHPYTGGDNGPYKDYRDYLIANNDGEFYTDYLSVTDPSDGFNAGFSVFGAGAVYYPRPDGIIVPEDFSHAATGVLNLVLVGNSFGGKGQAGYVEFDEAVRTRGIRFVIDDVLTPLGTAGNNFALEHFKIFSSDATGSYVSPVFDTGTPQNTERLNAVIHEAEGSSAAVYVRSYAEPPTLRYDPEYEVWKNAGYDGKGQDEFPTQPQTQDRALMIGDVAYFILRAGPFKYTPATDVWEIMSGGYPGGSSTEDFAEDDGTGSMVSPGYLPDDRVRGNTALLDGVIYIACFSTGGVRHPRMMKYSFSDTIDELAGWHIIGSLRPPESEYSCMAGYGRKMYFFGDYGTLSYFDIDEEDWVVSNIPFPTHGGDREGSTACTYGDKAYVFGGEAATARYVLDIFDFASKEFSSGTVLPFPFVGGQAIPVPEEEVIYLIPNHAYCATMKYFPEEDRWEVAESLLWTRDVAPDFHQGPSFVYYRDGYIYGLVSNYAGMFTKVRREPWAHGKMADFRDPVWGGPESLNNLPWRRIDSLGELMPQDRYFQFKVELYSDDREHVPTLESVTIVTPQDIPVPASGTADAFVKIGVSPGESYQAWYTGNGSLENYWSENDFSIIHTDSADGVVWNTPTLASGVWYPENLQQRNVSSPWVIRSSPSTYEHWFVDGLVDVYAFDRNIQYAVSASPLDLSGDVTAVSQGAAAQTSGGVYHPCVVRRSSTDYRLWCTGEDSGATKRIFYTTYSGSGAWATPQLVIDKDNDVANNYDQNGSYRPSVLEEEDGTFRVWYTGVGSDDKERILYATSADGVSWSVPRLVLDTGSEVEGLDRFGASRPMVMRDDSVYVMHYVGNDGTNEYVLRATSPDGWEWFDPTIVFPAFGVEGTKDSGGVLDFFVLANSGLVVPGEVITTAKLKIYNEGAAL